MTPRSLVVIQAQQSSEVSTPLTPVMEAAFSSTASLQPLSTTLSPTALNLSASTKATSLTDSCLQPSQRASAATNLVFIDAGLSDYQSLLAGVQPGTEVHLLNSAQDAVDQITQTLLGRTNIASLHIVSHGQAGGLELGNNWLSWANLRSYSSELQSWGKALTDDADILLYGCDVGQGAIGQSFVQQFAQLTGADIAASDNLTGSAALGGDWTLEVNTGAIAASLVFQASAIANYQHILPIDLISTANPNIPNDAAGGSDYFNISDDGRYVAFASSAGNLVANDTNNAQDIFVRDLQTGTTVLVSANSSGTATGNATSYISEISGNGRYVTFISDASDLVANDNNNASDVFVRDLVANTTTLVSVNSSGNGSGNGYTTTVSLRISSDGRYINFSSSASDLVVNDNNNQADIFRRDLVTGTTLLVSGNSAGTGSGNGTSSIPSMTRDGRYVVFSSTASNLVTNDTNGTTKDVFRWDAVTGVTTLVSANSSGTGSGNGFSGDANVRISDDGRYVAFTSTASNLVANDTNGGSQDVFVRDIQASTTTLVSVNSSGTGSGNGTSIAPPSLSSDGRYVAFASSASNLVANDTNGSQQDVFLRDLQTGTTTLVSADSTGTGSGNGLSGNASSGSNFVRLSSDGRYIAFVSYASNLVTNDTNGQADVFVRDRIAGTTTLVSHTNNGNAGNGDSYSPSPFSSNGRVIFVSSASDLAVNDANGAVDAFVYDATTNTNTLVSKRDPALPPSVSGGGSSSIIPNSVSADGRYMVFTSVAGNLVPNDNNNAQDVFLRDRTTGITTLISRTSTGKSGNAASGSPVISSDGSYIAFDSSASDLVVGDNNSTDTFLYDRITGTTTLVSRTDTGFTGFNPFYQPAISSDGSYVAFASTANNLAANDNNNTTDVFLWDRQTGATTLVSHTNTGNTGNNYSYSPTISNDGRYVVFFSAASDLVTGDSNNASDVFLWDRQTGSITLVSHTSTGSSSGSSQYQPMISGDGNYVAFVSDANNLVTGDSNNTSDVFLWERQTGNVTLVSRTSAGNSGNSASSTPVMSNDGRYVAFTSNANNLTAGDNNSTSDIYVYDRQTNAVKLVSHTSTGSSGSSYSGSPVISADGHLIAFTSSASDLVANDNNAISDVFVWNRQTDQVSLISRTNTGNSSNGSPNSPVLSSDGTYLIFSSYANNLITGDLNGNLDVFGAQISNAPTIALPGSNLTYVENNPATVLDSSATVIDTDSPNFDTGKLTVSFAANGTAADRLAILNQGTGVGQVGVSGSNVTYGGTLIGSLSGGMGTTPLVITFNASANAAAVQAVLRNLTFANVSDGPSTLPRTVSLVLTDNTGIASNTATKTINVTAVNDAPPAVQNDSYSTNEDTALTIAATAGVLSNDTDLDNDPMTATVVNEPSNGTLAFNPNGSFNYIPNLNFNGTDSFTYRVSDGTATSAIATATIGVNPVNDAPVNTVPSNVLLTDVSNTTSITIPDSGAGTPYGSTVNVAGVNGTISKLRVTLSNLSHTYPDDIDVLLVGPAGQRLLLMSDAGGSSRVSNVTLTFSDAATVALPDSGLISSGTYRPTNYDTSDSFPSSAPTGPYGSTLSIFNGTNPNGAWKLYVVDDAGGDAGAIAGGWSLSIETNSGSVSTIKNTPLVFSNGNGNQIAIADVDASNSPVQVSLTATNGTVALNGSAGLTVVGNGTATVNLTGTVANINSALNGLRFNPTTDFSGNGSLKIVTNDQGNIGTGGALSDTDTIDITVNASSPNTAPVLADTTVALNSVNEDASVPVGAVGTSIAQLVDLVGGSGQNNVTDSDTGAVTGIAITAVDTINGNWFYSTNNGVTWNPLGTVSNVSARLLGADANTRLYFQPNGYYKGAITSALTFQAWDQTTGTNGATADTTANGGSTAFSTAIDTASIMVNDVDRTEFVVTNTNEYGNGSLWWAISEANLDPGSETIRFNIPGSGVQTISQTVGLPDITDAVIIDGTTQPGFAGTPLIELSGNQSNAGLNLKASNSAIKGLVINRFQGGIIISGQGNRIQGNYIGTDATGKVGLGNSGSPGVSIENISNNIIGGTTPETRNLISGNATGVAIRFSGAQGNQILGNFIGTDITGTTVISSGVGVSIGFGANNNVIGGTTLQSRNLISGNSIGIDIGNSSNNRILGNFIGTNVSGTVALGNGTGVSIGGNSTFNNIVGGTTPNSRNLISGNEQYGVKVINKADANIILGNYIGTNVYGDELNSGSVYLRATVGVYIASSQNIVGGSTSGAGNLISGNSAAGVRIEGTYTSNPVLGNQVLGNYIGTDANGTAALRNSRGVQIIDARDNTVGGLAAGSRNLISGNDVGIAIAGSNPYAVYITGNKVIGNYIGTQADGTSPLGNTGTGVFLGQSAYRNTVGETESGASNTIAFNGYGYYGTSHGAGILLDSSSSTSNTILGNSIFSNSGLGIDLSADGVTSNDTGDIDTGSNNLQNFPVLTSATISGGSTAIAGTLNSTASTVFRLEFFANTVSDVSGHGQGQTYLGFTTITTDANGNAAFTFVTTGSLAGEVISATATDSNGNTSEFSGNQVAAPAVSISATTINQTEGNSDTSTRTFTVSLSGASRQTVTVSYMTADGTATIADNDYAAAAGTLTFNPRETSKTITVNVKGDTKVEQDETFLVKLLNPMNATIAPNANTGTGTIVNDDHAQLLWRNSVSGENAVWQLNGFTLQSSYYIPTVADTNWQMVSTADFDRDGVADILWRNRATGENTIWQMTSTGFQRSYDIGTVGDLNWQIVGTADFDRDGVPDILWRNQATGQNVIWQMNRFSRQSDTYFAAVGDLNWQIKGIADFNGDGTPDLVWRNKATGENAIWQMNGFSRQSATYFAAVGDLNWQIEGIADFNGDGIPDLVWRNKATGENAIWQMNGFSRQSATYFAAVGDLNWQIEGIADFNGDGTPDLVWRNKATGENAIWQMNGFSRQSATYINPAATDWHVKPFVAASILTSA